MRNLTATLSSPLVESMLQGAPVLGDDGLEALVVACGAGEMLLAG